MIALVATAAAAIAAVATVRNTSVPSASRKLRIGQRLPFAAIMIDPKVKAGLAVPTQALLASSLSQGAAHNKPNHRAHNRYEAGKNDEHPDNL